MSQAMGSGAKLKPWFLLLDIRVIGGYVQVVGMDS